MTSNPSLDLRSGAYVGDMCETEVCECGMCDIDTMPEDGMLDLGRHV